MTARNALLLALAGTLAVLGGAFAFQYLGGLAPCEICLVERWPYYATIPVALLAASPHPRAADLRVGGCVVALIFLAGSAVAFYHVGVEQHWFAGPTACTGSGGAASIDQLRALLLTQQPVRCDAPQWSLFGVTLAGFNLIASVGLAALGGVSSRLARREMRA
jgi:disulfide bond formation protein DsbB